MSETPAGWMPGQMGFRFDSKKPTKPEKRTHKCLDCPSLVTKNALRCKPCTDQLQRHPREICVWCNGPIQNLRNATYCSRDCSNKHRYSLLPQCVVCGNKVHTGRTACSQRCKGKSRIRPACLPCLYEGKWFGCNLCKRINARINAGIGNRVAADKKQFAWGRPLKKRRHNVPERRIQFNYLIAKYWEQGGYCAESGLELDPLTMQIDHRDALANGGTNTESNLQWVTPEVNAAKGKLPRFLFHKICHSVAARNPICSISTSPSPHAAAA